LEGGLLEDREVLELEADDRHERGRACQPCPGLSRRRVPALGAPAARSHHSNTSSALPPGSMNWPPRVCGSTGPPVAAGSSHQPWELAGQVQSARPQSHEVATTADTS